MKALVLFALIGALLSGCMTNEFSETSQPRHFFQRKAP